MSLLGSANHAVVDSGDDLPSYPTDGYIEHQLTTHGTMGCPFVAIDDVLVHRILGGQLIWPAQPYAVVVEKIHLPEVEEPVPNEEIIQEQETDRFRNFIWSLIEFGTEEADEELLIRMLHWARKMVLPKSVSCGWLSR